VLAHAPSLGLGGLVATGKKVLMSVNEGKTKTSHKIEMAITDDGVAVGANPLLAEHLATALLKNQLLPTIQKAEKITRHFKIDESKIDFMLEHSDGSKTLVGTKLFVLFCD
jgi:DNA-binding sugar fermentation-stimulating protein